MKIEDKKSSAKDVMIKFGVILGVLSLLANVIMYATDNYLTPHWSFGVLVFIMTIIVIIMGLKSFKENNNGFMKLGQAIKIGLGLTLIAAIIGSLWTVLLTQVLEPNYSELLLEATSTKMIEDNPDLSDAQMEQILSFQEPFTKIGFMIPVGIMMSLFVGFIVSLIGGLILKKENPRADA